MTEKSIEQQILEITNMIVDYKRLSAEPEVNKQMEKFKQDRLIDTYEGDPAHKEKNLKNPKSTVDRIVADAVREGQAHTRESLRELEEKKKQKQAERYDNWY